MGKLSDTVSDLSVSQVALVGLGLVALALPFVGLRSFSSSVTQSSEQSEFEAAAVIPSQRVSALGRLEPIDGVLTVGAPINEILANLTVKEGDWIDEGEVIAYLRSHSERIAQLESAKQDLANAKARLTAETRFNEAQIVESAADYQALPGVQAETLAARQATVGALKRELDFAQQELRRFQILYERGAIAESDLDQRQTTVDQLREQLRRAEAELNQQVAIRDRELTNAAAELNTLKVNTERIQADSRVETALRDLQLAEVRVEDTLIRAPISGRVLRVVTKEGETVSDINGRGKGAVLDMGDTRQMVVVAEVHESNISEVAVGQPATVTSRNNSFDEELTGNVIAIGNQIFKKDVLNDDPTARVDARVVEVKVLLDNPEVVSGLTNLQVEVDIDTSVNAALSSMGEAF